MKDELMNRLDAELAHAGEQTLVSPQMLMLEQMRITTDRELPPMEFLCTFHGKPCLPRREVVAVTGKAKSGKTFLISMLMACGLAPEVLSFRRMAEEPLRVMWYDTEQSSESTQEILRQRIVPLAGGSDDLVREQMDVFNVRCTDWKTRRALLAEGIRCCKPDLVVVDGLRDLVDDINDGIVAQELMESLMLLASEHDCCIVCVLHQNKGEDRNLRGWIGTELMNKAFEVYACEKLMPQRIFKVEQTLTRKHDIEQPMYFEVDDGGLPVKVSSAHAADTQQAMTAPDQDALPPLNTKYVIHDDGEPGGWRFDVRRLFLDALHGEAEVSGGELRERVMQLSNITIPFIYNKALNRALEEKVVERSMRGQQTIYRAPPF